MPVVLLSWLTRVLCPRNSAQPRIVYPYPFSHTGYFGFGRPSSRRRVRRGCRARPRRVAPRHAPRAGARARIRSARGHAPSIRCALRAALSHVENKIYIIQESNPLISLVGRDFRALSFEHGPTVSGAALGMLWFTYPQAHFDCA